MKRALTDAVGCAVLGGIAVIAVTLLHSGATGLAVDAYLLFLGARYIPPNIWRLETASDSLPAMIETAAIRI